MGYLLGYEGDGEKGEIMSSRTFCDRCLREIFGKEHCSRMVINAGFDGWIALDLHRECRDELLSLMGLELLERDHRKDTLKLKRSE